MIQIEVLGEDFGYGNVKEAFRDENGNIKTRKYASLIAKAPQEAEDMPIYDGQRYYIGDEALMRSADEIIDTTEYMVLERVSPLFFRKTIKDNNLDWKKIKKVVTGLSFANKEKGNDFKKKLERFKINKEVYDFRGKIVLLPQGIGAKYTIEHFFPDGEKTYLIIDIGSNTIDSVDVINGTVRMENVHGFSGEGIIKIARNLQDYINTEFGELISLKEANEILETKSFYLEGEDYDLKEVIEGYSKTYTEQTMKNLRDRFPREFKKYRTIYFVGGGAHFIDPEYSKTIKIVPEPEYYNAIGNLLKGEELLEKDM